MLLIGGKTPEEAQLNIIPLAPLFPPRKLYKEGVRVTPFNYERAFPKAKTLNMLMSYIAFREAKKDSSYDALLIDSEGMVLEGSRCNFFAMKGRELISPPEEKILDGITRENVLKVALENGYTLTYDDIPLEKIGDYDGLFLTSTSAKLLPISKVGNLETPISSELFELIKLVKKSGKV